jgi:hypothetical protein
VTGRLGETRQEKAIKAAIGGLREDEKFLVVAYAESGRRRRLGVWLLLITVICCSCPCGSLRRHQSDYWDPL